MRSLDPTEQHVDYLVWQAEWRNGYCRLGSLQNVERRGEIAYSVSRANGFPADACFAMDMDFPNDTLLADRLANPSDLVVVSERVVEVLRSHKVGPMEVLPVTIFDHRARAVEERYFIVNPLSPVSCLDVDACEPRWNTILPGKIWAVRKLVLDPARIDGTRQLFSCDQYHEPKLVRRSLAEAMQAEGFTGSRFVETRDFRA